MNVRIGNVAVCVSRGYCGLSIGTLLGVAFVPYTWHCCYVNEAGLACVHVGPFIVEVDTAK